MNHRLFAPLLLAGACSPVAPSADDAAGATSSDPCVAAAVTSGAGLTAACAGEMTFNGAAAVPVSFSHTVAATRSGSTSEVSSAQGDGDDIVVTIDDRGDIHLHSTVDGDVELALAAGPDGITLTTWDNDGLRQLPISCSGLDGYIDRLAAGGDPDTCPAASAWDAADATVGCFTCSNLDTQLNQDPIYLRMIADEDSRMRLARFHVALEQHAELHRSYGDPSRAEVVAVITAIASVFRFAFDSDGYYGEFGAESSGTWTTGYHNRDD